jgi:hypothetical protein
MTQKTQRIGEIPNEIKDFVVDYYISGIPEGLIAIYTDLEVFEVIAILKNKGLYKKDIHVS